MLSIQLNIPSSKMLLFYPNFDVHPCTKLTDQKKDLKKVYVRAIKNVTDKYSVCSDKALGALAFGA